MRTSLTAILAFAALATASAADAAQATWRFDNLSRIGGFKAEPEGEPKVIPGPYGKAVQFDGNDSLFVAGRPLTGAKTFTIEMVFRPEGGPFQQRVMHMAETDP